MARVSRVEARAQVRRNQGWKKFNGNCRHCGEHGHMERDCWWKNTDRATDIQELSQVVPTQLRLGDPPSLTSVPSVSRTQNEALDVSEEVPQEPWIFSLYSEQDSERRDREPVAAQRSMVIAPYNCG